MTEARWLDGVGGLADRYDAFFLDQFGVLHDGETPYPGVVHCLENLKERGRRVVILSNSGRRSEANVERLERLGIPAALYDRLVSSGDLVWDLLSEGALSHLRGKRCLLFSRGGDRSVVEGLDMRLVDDAAEADLIISAGTEAPRLRFEDYEPHLRLGAGRGLPLICANPDQVMVTPQGPMFSAGRLARFYEGLGGRVEWVGKPYPAIYRFALDLITPGGERPRIVMVGDSVEHDVAGARGAGIDAAFLTGGIHADVPAEGLPDLFRRYGVTPDWILSGLAW